MDGVRRDVHRLFAALGNLHGNLAAQRGGLTFERAHAGFFGVVFNQFADGVVGNFHIAARESVAFQLLG